MNSLHDPLTDFRQKDVTQAASRFFNRLAASLLPAEDPCAVLLGGQPGAGKTTLARTLFDQFHGNVLVISGDDFRSFHPNHVQLVEKYGKDATPAASAFSGAVVEQLIDRASDAKLNLIVEGTLRTTEVPVTTCRILKERGYTVSLSCMAVRPEISYISTLYRYEHMRESGATPRATAKEVHDQTVLALPQNLNTLYGTGLFDLICLHSRDGSCVYDSTAERCPPAERLLAIQHAPWTREDTELLIDLVERTEALMLSRRAPELPTFLRERTALLPEERELFLEQDSLVLE